MPVQSMQGEVWLSPAGLCAAVGSAGMSHSGCSEVGAFGAAVVPDAAGGFWGSRDAVWVLGS